MLGQLSFQVAGDRPIIQVEVKPSLLAQHHLFANAPHRVPSAVVPFLIDTGSPCCVIDESVVDTWRLRKHSYCTISTGLNGAHLRPRHDLSLRLHTHAGSDSWLHGVFPAVSVPAGNFGKEPYLGIVGMDLLSWGTLKFAGRTGTFSLWW